MTDLKARVSVCVVVGILAGTAVAVTIETVPVGNPGNAPDTRYGSPVHGSVGYTYNIGKYEVTAAQYAAFLNAVAATDTYGLYSTFMDTANYAWAYGCNIKRSGSPGSYTYSVASDWANRPVNLVSWGSAARFANWLANGQPTGPQNASTTEDGSYYLNGATDYTLLTTVTRKANAIWVISTEDEWYKAAYYDPNKPGGAGYWDYPTRSNTVPSNVLDPSGTNNANYYNNGYTIGAPYYRTEVGAFASSPSAYGTFDQGGNVFEWNEAVIGSSNRGLRGGSFVTSYDYGLRATLSIASDTTSIYGYYYGFRVAEVPEPTSLAILPLGGIGMLIRRRGWEDSPLSLLHSSAAIVVRAGFRRSVPTHGATSANG